MKNTILRLAALLLIILSCSMTSAAQEICANGIDDDGDGLFDCADPDCALECEETIPCSNDLYQVVSGVLKQFDPLTSTYTDIGTSGFGSYNGAGYNVQDGYIYAVKAFSGVQNIVKIKSDGTGEVHGPVNNFTGITYSADIDADGNWIAYTSGSNPQLRKIDLDVFPLTMQTFPLTNLFGANIPTCADITFNPKTNKYYGMSSNYRLVEIDPVNLTVNQIYDETNSSGGFGAAWSDIDGNSYFSDNSTGQISLITFDNDGNVTGRSIVAQGAITNNNDGINCMLSLPPFETVCDDGIDNDGDGFIDMADPDCVIAPPLELAVNEISSFTGNSWGITAVDYNDDCLDDVYIPSYSENEAGKLFLNNGDETFTEQTGFDLVNNTHPSVTGSWGDINNDGFIDIAVANNVGEGNAVYLNNNFSFNQLSENVVSADDHYAHSVTQVDVNNDSFLDLFITDYFESKFNNLYLGDGTGNYTKLTQGEIVNDAAPSIGAVWADVNGDGWQDAFVPNYGSSNVLYINNGDLTFEKVLMGDSSNSSGATFGDIDNDGDFDLYVSNASKQDNILYENDGNGNFTVKYVDFLSNDGGDSHGAAFGDFDNDGWLDLYVANDREANNFLYINDGTGSFTKLVNAAFLNVGGNSFGVATSDYNSDGYLDIVIANHSGEQNFVLKNEGTGRNWMELILKGTNSNKSAIGAKIELTANINGSLITQTRMLAGSTGGGPGSQSSLTQHFGLSNASFIQEVKIYWPSGYVQTVTGLSVNQKHMITEPNGNLFSGYAYYDANGNCVKDQDEVALSNVMISGTVNDNGSISEIAALTDDNGYYEFYTTPGTVQFSGESLDNYNQNCTTSYSETVNSIGQVYPDNNFAYSSSTAKADIIAEIGITALRRGFENEMRIFYSNEGVVTAKDVVLTLTLDSDVSLAASIPPHDNSNGLSYSWNLGQLAPGESADINLLNYVDLAAVLNSYKDFTVSITTSDEEYDYTNNQMTVSEKIVGSVDPNDLLASPAGYGPSHIIPDDQRITYRVRFQNVGNYPAYYIHIYDTLPAELDISSLDQNINSHPEFLAEFEIIEGNILHWYFEAIELPDSVNNEPDSHGFVQFSILPKEGLSEGTVIKNSADIRFDFNPYIKTNFTTHSLTGNIGSIDQEKERVFIYPNPANDQFSYFIHQPKDAETFRSDLFSTPNSFETVSVFDAVGRLRWQEEITDCTDKQISVRGLEPGYYLVEIEDQYGQIFSEKLIIQR